jgi:hypothetical protein
MSDTETIQTLFGMILSINAYGNDLWVFRFPDGHDDHPESG